MINKNTFVVVQRILIFTIFIVVLDFLIGSGLEYVYFNQKVGLYARTTYGLEKTEADLLIFGPSGANHHYNPEIFEKILNITAYNEGRDGIDILYHNAILKGILRRYTPKIVILNLAPNELSLVRDYDRLSSLLPYCKKYPEMKEVVALKGSFENWKLYSKIYPYNSTFLTLLNGFHRITGKKIQDKGYVPLFGTIGTNSLNGLEYIDYLIDSNKVIALGDFMNQCKTRDISVYMIFSPFFSSGNQETKTIKVAKKISEEKSIPCLNFINDSIFNGKPSLFKDISHMNHDGACKFSEIIAGLILEDFEKKNQNK